MHLILVLLAFLAANPAAGQVRIARIGIVNSLKDMGLARSEDALVSSGNYCQPRF